MVYLLTDELSSVLVRGQLGYLVEHGFDVTVAAGGGGEPDVGRWDPGVDVVRLPFVREPSPVADVRALLATIRLIRRVRPHAVNASTPKAGLLGMIAAWACRVPVRVHVVRGFRFETATGLRRCSLRLADRIAIACSTIALFNSRSLLVVGTREGVVRPGRASVIGAGSGNGIDLDRFGADRLPSRDDARHRFGIPLGASVVGFVGRLTRDKGVDDLVAAFAPIAARDPEARLLLVGTSEPGDPIDPSTRTAIEDHDSIVVVPWLDHPGAAYRAMDVLAFPSYREGLPNVPLEAQLCGVPVVGYAATGTIDAVRDGETGVLVAVGDVTALRTEIESLLADPARRIGFGNAGPAWVASAFGRSQHWEAIAELLAGSGRPT